MSTQENVKTLLYCPHTEFRNTFFFKFSLKLLNVSSPSCFRWLCLNAILSFHVVFFSILSFCHPNLRFLNYFLSDFKKPPMLFSDVTRDKPVYHGGAKVRYGLPRSITIISTFYYGLLRSVAVSCVLTKA